MLKREFEERVGVEVSDDFYKKVEVIYNNTDIDKDTFCNEWSIIQDSEVMKDLSDNVTALTRKKDSLVAANATLVKTEAELIGKVEALEAKIADLKDYVKWHKEAIISLASELLHANDEGKVVEILGPKYTIAVKCADGWKLSDEDRKYLAENLQEI